MIKANDIQFEQKNEDGLLVKCDYLNQELFILKNYGNKAKKEIRFFKSRLEENSQLFVYSNRRLFLIEKVDPQLRINITLIFKEMDLKKVPSSYKEVTFKQLKKYERLDVIEFLSFEKTYFIN